MIIACKTTCGRLWDRRVNIAWHVNSSCQQTHEHYRHELHYCSRRQLLKCVQLLLTLMTIDFTASSDKHTVSYAVSSMFVRMCCFHLNVVVLRPSDSFWQKASRFFVIKQTRKLIVKYNPSKLLSIYAKFNNGDKSQKNCKSARFF